LQRREAIATRQEKRASDERLQQRQETTATQDFSHKKILILPAARGYSSNKRLQQATRDDYSEHQETTQTRQETTAEQRETKETQ